MKSQEIINTAQKSKNESDLIRTIAGDIKSSMDYIIQLASESPTPPSPDPDPIPPTPPNTELTGIVDIRSLGAMPIDDQIKGFKYKDSYHNGIQIHNDAGKVFYTIFIQEVGNITFENILTNGNPTEFEIKETGVHILKNDNGQFLIEPVLSYISDSFLKKYDFSNCTLYIPTGTYIHFQGHGINTLFFFERNQPKLIFGGNNTVLLGLTNNPDGQIPRIDCKLENLTLHNIIPSTGSRNRSRSTYLNNVNLNFGSITTPSTYLLMCESNQADFFANKLSINAKEIYTGIWIEDANNIVFSNSSIKVNHSSHPIRVNAYENSCLISGNDISGTSTTGIQFATQRRQLIKNAVISKNKVSGCTEESISIDSFGNNTSLVPVIVKSFVSKCDQWISEGFILGSKITLSDLIFVRGNHSSGFTHEIVSPDFVGDPTKYLFMVEGGRLEYQFCEIVKSEVVEGKIMLYLNQFYDTNDLKDVEIGLHTGAINCVIEGNTVKNARPETSQPGHAISLWGATYDCSILNNNIDNCKQGIHVAGYGSFGVTDPDFFNYSIRNNVEGNTITNCDESVAFRSFYGERKGFFNRFVNNTVKGGTIEIKDQIGFINENNNIS